ERVLKGDLHSPKKFRIRWSEYVGELKDWIEKEANVSLDVEELSDLLLSTCRSNDFNVIIQKDKKLFLNKDRIIYWVKEKLIPNTVIVALDDEDVIRLLIFCIEITYQMFSGGTRATVMQKGFRQSRRTFEEILVDQFIGKFGEVITKKFLEKNFPVKIELDWEISTDIEKFRNDIVNSFKKVSIKSSPALTGIWAEADVGYDYGICVKCSLPQPILIQFFIEVCGFSRLLDFAEKNIPFEDDRFRNYLGTMRMRVSNYKCGEIQSKAKGFVCGYFKTSKNKIKKLGEELDYMGEVREERYLVTINKLKYKKDDWVEFLSKTKLM
ncbi:unnamed protein product, partial [marine sediment metagenome]